MSDRPDILLVEDEPLSQDVLARSLTAYGYDVHIVHDGVACLEWLSDNRCDLILLDMAMPRMNGVDTLRQIRRSFSHDSLPVIIVSALVDSDDVVAGLEAGANDYVVKPVNFRVLAARVHACLRMRKTVSLLVEAERQRVMIETLGKSAAKLGEPLKHVIDTLERAAHNALTDDAMQRDLGQVATLVEDVISVIEQLKVVGQPTDLPYRERLELLNDGENA